MTRHEINQLLTLLIATYPNHPVPDPDALVLSWEIGVGDLPYGAVKEAVVAWVRSSERFFPTSGQIRQLVIDDTGVLPSGPDAWAMIQERMKATYPGHPAPPWDAPECVRLALKARGGMEIVRHSEEPQILRAQFLKTYEIYRQRATQTIDVVQVLTDRAAIEVTVREPMLAPRGADNGH